MSDRLTDEQIERLENTMSWWTGNESALRMENPDIRGMIAALPSLLAEVRASRAAGPAPDATAPDHAPGDPSVDGAHLWAESTSAGITEPCCVRCGLAERAYRAGLDTRSCAQRPNWNGRLSLRAKDGRPFLCVTCLSHATCPFIGGGNAVECESYRAPPRSEAPPDAPRSVAMTVVPSWSAAGRLSARYEGHRTIHSALDALGAKPGDVVTLSLAGPRSEAGRETPGAERSPLTREDEDEIIGACRDNWLRGFLAGVDVTNAQSNVTDPDKARWNRWAAFGRVAPPDLRCRECGDVLCPSCRGLILGRSSPHSAMHGVCCCPPILSLEEPAGRSTSGTDAAPWYNADGSTVMLPAEEVTRRRKLAAKVIEAAKKVVDFVPTEEGYALDRTDARILDALTEASDALDAASPSAGSKEPTPSSAPVDAPDNHAKKEK